MIMGDASNQFDRIEVVVGQKAPAYRAYVAIWQRGKHPHVAIAAPTVDALEDQWERITNTDLDKNLVQEVFLCSVRHASETNFEQGEKT
jgi:hypothetical protein